MESVAAKREQLLNAKLLPKWKKSNTDTAAPTRPYARSDTDAPRQKLSSNDIEEPKRATPKTAIVDPKRAKVRIDKAAPM
jgi:hypothetical protein